MAKKSSPKPKWSDVKKSLRSLDKTDLTEDQIGEYSGEVKETRPVTISTYQILTYRNKDGEYPHFALFSRLNWGVIIYDEVHLLPAPVFRITAELQAKRRLGLTATLVREDGKEEDVYTFHCPVDPLEWVWIMNVKRDDDRRTSLIIPYLKRARRFGFRRYGR